MMAKKVKLWPFWCYRKERHTGKFEYYFPNWPFAIPSDLFWGKHVQVDTKLLGIGKIQELAEMFLDLCMQEAALRRTDGGNLLRESWNKIQCAFKQEKGIYTREGILNQQ